MKPVRRILALVLSLTFSLALPALAAEYSDVPDGAWYADAVAWAEEAGVMKGTSETAFSPDGPVTRGMVVTVLWRLAGSPEPEAPAGFSDVEDWYYYAQAAAWAQAAGIAAGVPGGAFRGGEPVTREELAVFLYRCRYTPGQEVAQRTLDPYGDADQIQSWALDGMAYAVGMGWITGGDGGTLSPGSGATRAQLAVILQRMETPAMG